jgi:Flp pilus assembly protein TadB
VLRMMWLVRCVNGSQTQNTHTHTTHSNNTHTTPQPQTKKNQGLPKSWPGTSIAAPTRGTSMAARRRRRAGRCLQRFGRRRQSWAALTSWCVWFCFVDCVCVLCWLLKQSWCCFCVCSGVLGACRLCPPHLCSLTTTPLDTHTKTHTYNRRRSTSHAATARVSPAAAARRPPRCRSTASSLASTWRRRATSSRPTRCGERVKRVWCERDRERELEKGGGAAWKRACVC